MNLKVANTGRHVTPLTVYLGVGAALFVLTAITVGVAQIHLGGWNAIVAVLIASVKATLVAFIFMHLWYDRKIFLIIFSIAVLFLTIFIALTMFDILSRGDIGSTTTGPIEIEAKMYERLEADTSTHHDAHLDSSADSNH